MSKISALLLLSLAGSALEPARALPVAPPSAVRVAKAERASRPVLTELVASVRALREGHVRALISGTVAELRVGLGSSVRAGELLVRLSAREVDARLAQARALSARATPEHECDLDCDRVDLTDGVRGRSKRTLLAPDSGRCFDRHAVLTAGRIHGHALGRRPSPAFGRHARAW